MNAKISDKTAIRRKMREMRRALTEDERLRSSEIICSALADDESLTAAMCPPDGNTGILAVYLASPFEIDLSRFIEKTLEKKIITVAPRWNGETYELAKITGLSSGDLRRGPMNILEPAEAGIIGPERVNAWIIPGLAFTANGKRLGYGGGWYDRLLEKSSADSLKIGVAHAFQISDDLPTESHDILLDRVVTDVIRG